MKHLYLLLFIALVSCNPKQETTSSDMDTTETVPSDTTAVDEFDAVFSMAKFQADKIPTEASAILAFNEKGAISVYPDSAWVAQHEKDSTDESFNTEMDDFTYYESLAIDTLKSKNFKVYEEVVPGKQRYYKFSLAGGREFYADMSKAGATWGMILYNGKDVPTFVSLFSVADVMDSLLNK